MTAIHFDEDTCYEALLSRDARFDGQFIAAITSTGIYCRASCPAPVRPKRKNVRVFATAAAAQAAGFRSCKRCRPDASPGSPEWDRRADLVGQAMRLIESGAIDRLGVAGLASQLAVSERHLHRSLVEAVGASPIELARTQRTNLARILLETSQLTMTDVAFAAGFSSIRQFNDTVKATFDRTPSEIRKAAPEKDASTVGTELTVKLAVREPYDAAWMLRFHNDHAIPGVVSKPADAEAETLFRRSLRLPSGPAVVSVATTPDLHATLSLSHLADVSAALAKVRSMFDLDADPVRIGTTLDADLGIRTLRSTAPGIRVPGAPDPFESIVGAIIGQQISIAGARTILGRLVEACATDELPDAMTASDSPTRLFPTPSQLLDTDITNIGLTTRRQNTLLAVAEAIVQGRLDLSDQSPREETKQHLLAVPGIGPWTVDVVSMRGLRDPDVLLRGDLIANRAFTQLGINLDDTGHLAPWRSYVTTAAWAYERFASSTQTGPNS